MQHQRERERQINIPAVRPAENQDIEINHLKKISRVCAESFVAGIFFGLGWLGTFYILKNKIVLK